MLNDILKVWQTMYQMLICHSVFSSVLNCAACKDMVEEEGEKNWDPTNYGCLFLSYQKQTKIKPTKQTNKNKERKLHLSFLIDKINI